MKSTLKQLEYVYAAGKFLSIAVAAKQMNISQSSIGTAINLVEHEFEVTIFIRQRSRGLAVTSEGKRFLARLEHMLAEVERFSAEAMGQAEDLRGELKVGCFAALAPHVLPVILTELSHQHPNLTLHVYEGHLRRVQEQLLNGSTDFALTYDLGLSDQIETETLGEAPPHIVMAEDDPLATRSTVSLTDLAGRRMILLDIPESRDYFERLLLGLENPPRIIHRTETYEMVRASVAAGLGISVLNLKPLIDETYIGAKTVCRPFDAPLAAPKFVLAQRRNSYSSRAVAAFSACCRKYFATPQALQHVVRGN